MPLASAQIVDAIATRISGLPLAGADVYTSRAWPLAAANLPAWKVVAVDEVVEPMTVHTDPVQKHELQVELRGHVAAVEDLDDDMHALAAEALTALFDTTPPADALTGIDGKLQRSLRRIERAMQPEGQAHLGLVVITLRVDFRTRASAPQTLV
jgi:hypothetical protein